MSDKRESLQQEIERLERQIFIATEDSGALDKSKRDELRDPDSPDTSIESLEQRVKDLERQLRSLE